MQGWLGSGNYCPSVLFELDIIRRKDQQFSLLAKYFDSCLTLKKKQMRWFIADAKLILCVVVALALGSCRIRHTANGR
jgi:hypothetical protein